MKSADMTAGIPRHVAVIMDGNGRWARQRGLPRLKGHEEGVKSVEVIVRACRESGVKYLTLYAFSTENWSRPRAEVSGLMRLLLSFLREHADDFHKNKLRLRVMGRLDDLPVMVRRALRKMITATADYDQGTLILALSYGSRDEIVHTVRQIARRAAVGEIKPEAVDEDMLAAGMYVPDVPDPDLLIRTSGELRLSNFMLWQLSYAELYFTDVLWPDFREDDFKSALAEYGRRQRRFGGIQAKPATGGNS